jgi:hypothetical protein
MLLNHLWVIVKGIDWNDDDRVMDFIEYMSLKQEDILVEYGYHISLMPILLPGDTEEQERVTEEQFTPLVTSAV